MTREERAADLQRYARRHAKQAMDWLDVINQERAEFPRHRCDTEMPERWAIARQDSARHYAAAARKCMGIKEEKSDG